MPSVFTPGQRWNGSFRADLLQVTFGGQSAGLLVQNVNFDFAQMVNMLFEIGTTNVYYVGGHAQGTAGLERIVGPGKCLAQMFATFGNICSPQPIDFTAAGGTCGGSLGSGGSCAYHMKYAVLTRVAGSVNVNDIVIREQLQMMFADLEVDA